VKDLEQKFNFYKCKNSLTTTAAQLLKKGFLKPTLNWSLVIYNNAIALL
jgi:hypothetical protein